MVSNNSNFNSSLIAEVNTEVIGTPHAFDSYCSTCSEDQTNIKCYSATSEKYPGISVTEYIAELSTSINPFTGYQYPLVDHFQNTTAFEKEILYSDSCRYFLTSEAIDSFSRTFPSIDLNGNQLAAAYTAFCRYELGYKFFVIAHSDEFSLVNFCKTLGCNYLVVS